MQEKEAKMVFDGGGYSKAVLEPFLPLFTVSVLKKFASFRVKNLFN